jgi:type IV secretory pathway VirB10-like protein
MNKITTTISEVKKSMPKHVLWIVLFAAFLVVVILLVLLLSGGDDKNSSGNAATTTKAELVLNIDPDEIAWLDVPIGDTLTQQIQITTNDFAIIPSVKLSKEINGLTIATTCTNLGEIAPEIPCSADLSWTPDSDLPQTGVKVVVEYYSADAEAKMAQTTEIPVVLSTKAPAPVIEPEPEPAPIIAAPIIENPVVDTIETLAPPLSELMLPPITTPATSALNTERCYEFAFGGFDTYGKQIGWIRPQSGRYLFHPFSDANCTEPTGEYNPSTGFITDLKNPGKKIGSDFDRVSFSAIGAGVPLLSNPAQDRKVIKTMQSSQPVYKGGGMKRVSALAARAPESEFVPTNWSGVASSKPQDRSFILRQYKPIPATIVDEVRADAERLEAGLPVRATVDRNVFADNGRTIIIPTGTLMLGYVDGNMPGPYKAIGRMGIKWYQFIRPDGVEFNFEGNNPFSADSQGRVGVPGYGSTDYLEQFIMPMITAIVPAAVNLIAPISDRFINQIDLDNNTVTQSGQVRSSELAKNEIISTWNKVAQRLMVDMMDNTVPPFSIAAGTRITVFSPVDLMMTCGDAADESNPNKDKKCAIYAYGNSGGKMPGHDVSLSGGGEGPEWVGQVRSFNIQEFCGPSGQLGAGVTAQTIAAAGYDYRTVVAYCQASQYQAIANAQQAALYANQQQTMANQNYGIAAGNPAAGTIVQGNQAYNEQVLGLQYNDDGTIKNPFAKETPPAAAAVLTCEDGTPPDATGCCTGEIYTDMGEQGFNCCPASGGDCFPPIL